MSSIPNLNDVQPPGIVKPGLYLAKIDGAEQKDSKSGKEMLEVRLELLGTGDMLFEYFVYENNIALRRLKELVVACGLDPDGGFPVDQLEDCKVGVDVACTGNIDFPTKVRQYLDPAHPDAEWANDGEDEDVPF